MAERDGEIARLLQEKFDKEAADAEICAKKDYHLAMSLQKTHSISDSEEELYLGSAQFQDVKVLVPDSDSEQGAHSVPQGPSLSQTSTSTSLHTISDSDTEGDVIPPTQPKPSRSGRQKPVKQPYQFKRSSSSLHPVSDSDSDSERQKPAPKKARRSTDNNSVLDKYSLADRDGRKIPNNPKCGSDQLDLKSERTELGKPLSKSATLTNSERIDTISYKQSTNAQPVCPFGVKCYRKNPSHFEEYSHKGDGDDSPASKRGATDESLAGPSTREYGVPVRKPGSKRVKEARPFGFLLTQATGIAAKFNDSLAIHISDILSPCMGNLQKSAQFNYMIVLPWLVSQYPKVFRTQPMLVVHGFQRQEKKELEAEAKIFPHVSLCQAKLEILYGTHHTKMMLLQYDKGMRVVIHTANLIDRDWYQKTQGVWVSPVFPPLGKESATEGDSSTRFKHDLLEYLAAYKSPQLHEWMKISREHDMSLARVHIIGSVPGRHVGEKKSAFGHMKLRKTLVNYGPDPKQVAGWPVIGQFSSIGSLGANKDNWVCGEWLTSLAACQGRAGLGSGAPKVQLVFPTKDNIRLSLEGYPAGGSVPYSINVARKQPWLHNLFHQWRSRVRGRSGACPHIKTYMRASGDYSKLAWFLVTSANLSKAAWGAMEKNGSQLMIRSYEIGVLFIPEHFGPEPHFQVMNNMNDELRPSGQSLVFPVPYDLPPTPYDKTDRPWVWDIPYVDKPDSHGNMWCPP